MGPRDLNSAPYSPVHCSSHSMTSFQSSELTELPVVENGQLFAQRAHSACTARAQRTVCPHSGGSRSVDRLVGFCWIETQGIVHDVGTFSGSLGLGGQHPWRNGVSRGIVVTQDAHGVPRRPLAQGRVRGQHSGRAWLLASAMGPCLRNFGSPHTSCTCTHFFATGCSSPLLNSSHICCLKASSRLFPS